MLIMSRTDDNVVSMIESENDGELVKVWTSLSIPKYDNKGIEILIGDVIELIINRIDLDSKWWPGVDKTIRQETEGEVYEQDVNLLIAKLFHRIEVIERKVGFGGAYVKTVAYPRMKEKGLQLSYIAYYNVNEEEGYYKFVLEGYLQMPKIGERPVAILVRLIAGVALKLKLKKLFTSGKYRELL